MLGAVEFEFYDAAEPQIEDHIFEWLDDFYPYEAIVERVEQEGSDVFVYLEIDLGDSGPDMWETWCDGVMKTAVGAGLASGGEVTDQDYGF